jgi:hypothetical protein
MAASHGLWEERKNVAEVLTSGIANHDRLPIPPTMAGRAITSSTGKTQALPLLEYLGGEPFF